MILITIYKYSINIDVKFYVDELHGVGCQFLIDKPTRIRNGKYSLVDHILTNDVQNSVTPGILLADVSDHLPICLVLKNTSMVEPQYPRMVRDYSNFNQIPFLEDLSLNLEPLKYIPSNNSCNTIFNNFLM